MTMLVKPAVKNPTGVALLPTVRPPRQVNRARKQQPTYLFRIRPTAGGLMLITIITLAVVVLGFISGMVIFREYMRGTTIRYHGTCTITSTKDNDYVLVNAMPNTKLLNEPDGLEINLYSSASDLISPRLFTQLLEELAIDENMETITVHDGRHSFDVIHDFKENITSIRNNDRCFVMSMIRDFVLEPRHLIDGFHNESKLDLTHAHSFFRADLPAVFYATASNAGLAKNCFSSKPIYRLNLEDTLILRKRSVDVNSTDPCTTVPPAEDNNCTKIEPQTDIPMHDFVQFSGKHLQRITISNMDDILKYEMANSVKVHPKLGVTSQ